VPELAFLEIAYRKSRVFIASKVNNSGAYLLEHAPDLSFSALMYLHGNPHAF
jgi:hypothetical protein